ncbi:MAG TPA: copper-containing nitrite reductase [Candidatus Limnocylindria bacterium]|nr:copper-containing nitrite reductase [Candidatus Limnocylindria bacterium]
MSSIAREPRGGDLPSAFTGALFGALAIGVATALVVGVLGATGNIRSGGASQATTGGAATTAMPGMSAVPGTVPQTGAGATQVTLPPAKAVTAKTIARPATDVAAPVNRAAPATVRVDLQTQEVTAEIEKGETYTYWTFNGQIPGPMIRVRVGDTVELHLKNSASSVMTHSIDLHAVNGPGGGATATQTMPGMETTVTFKALNPGAYIYHCATAPIPQHIANGMYGMIVVEPEAGLPKVDREFYVMQAELYTSARLGVAGHHDFDAIKMDNEEPDYVVFNGKVGSLTGDSAMKANVGETVRIFFGVGGFLSSNLHLIGEIFDKVYPEAAFGSPPNQNVQTTVVPAGGATVVEFKLNVPGTYTLVDHALPRALDKGAAAQIVVAGAEDKTIYSGPLSGAGH